MAAPKRLSAEDQAQREEEGLTNLVTRRLISRQRPWIHEGETYQMTWNDCGCFSVEDIRRKVHELLGTVGISNVTVRSTEAGGVRISMPQGVYEAQLRGAFAANETPRVHVVGGRR